MTTQEFSVLPIDTADQNGNLFPGDEVLKAFNKNNGMPLPVYLNYGGQPVGSAVLTKIENGQVMAKFERISPAVALLLKNNPGGFCAGAGVRCNASDIDKGGIRRAVDLTFHTVGLFPTGQSADFKPRAIN